MRRKSIWFLLAAVVSLHGVAFAEEDNNNNNDSSSTEVVSQERDQEREGPEASKDQPQCR